MLKKNIEELVIINDKMWVLLNWSYVDFGLGNGLKKWLSWGIVFCLIRCGYEILLCGRWKLYIYI